jgi:hypothetical protein
MKTMVLLLVPATLQTCPLSDCTARSSQPWATIRPIDYERCRDPRKEARATTWAAE